MIVLTPFSKRAARAIESDYRNGYASTYIKTYAGESDERCKFIVARYMEEHGIYGKVGTAVTRDGSCIEVIYERG